MSKRWVILVVVLSSLVLVAGCGDPPTKVGDVCQIDDHCGGAEGTFELACDISIPGGVCMVQGCTADDKATPEDEDDGTCPDGSRCVMECPEDDDACANGDIEWSLNLCRRTCDQQSDCGEVIVCGIVCETDDEGVETCSEKCKNEMECAPFWSPLLESGDCDQMEVACLTECGDEDQTCKDKCSTDKKQCKSRADDPPRACILKGRLFKPSEG